MMVFTRLKLHYYAARMGWILQIVLRLLCVFLRIWASWFRTSNDLGSCYLLPMHPERHEPCDNEHLASPSLALL